MSFNRQNEYKKFKKKQTIYTSEYVSLGMSAEAIKEIQVFDKEQFLSDMKFYSHNQSLNICIDDMEDESLNPLLKRYFNNLVTYQENIGDWIDQIGDENLRKTIKELSITNRIIIKMLYDGYKIVEIAEILTMPKSTVSYRVKRIRLVLLPYMSALFPETFGGNVK